MTPEEQIVEQLLVLRCQIGDRGALEKLILKYHKPLSNFIGQLLKSPEEIEDVLQNTWLTVIRKISNLKEPGKFLPWLYCIARNYAYKELKKRKQKPVPFHEEAAPIHEDHTDKDWLQSNLKKMHHCLDELAPIHKEILILRLFEEMSYEDISCVIKCNLGTVRSRLHNAKISLKKEMENRT